MYGGHPFSHRIKGNLIDARIGLLKIRTFSARLSRSHDQRGLGWIAYNAGIVGAILVFSHFKFGVVGQHRHPESCSGGGIFSEIHLFAVHFKLSRRFVAAASDREVNPVNPHAGNCHLVLCQCASFIRTNYGCRSKGFNRGQPSDESMAINHLAHSNCQRDSHYGRKPLRYSRHRQTYCDEEHLERFDPPHPSKNKHQPTDDQCRPPKDLAKFIQSALERGRLFVNRLQHGCDHADLSFHARADHNAFAASVGNQRSAKGSITTITQGFILGENNARVLLNRN